MKTARGSRRAATAAFAMVLGLVGVASFAWACTPQAEVAPLAVQSGAPGTRVPVTGLAAKPGPIEVRWNSPKGPLVGTGVAAITPTGLNFATEVTIPEAEPGVYYLVVSTSDGGTARAAFEVLSPAASAPTAAAPTPALAPGTEALWNGLGNGSPVPGPETSLGSPAGSGMAIGVGLAAVGLVGMFAGFTTVALRRQRRLAGRGVRR